MGIMIGVGAPTSLAIDLANRFDMTLVGFVKDDSFNVYTNVKSYGELKNFTVSKNMVIYLEGGLKKIIQKMSENALNDSPKILKKLQKDNLGLSAIHGAESFYEF